MRSSQTRSAWVRSATSSICDFVCGCPNQGAQSLFEPGTSRSPNSTSDAVPEHVLDVVAALGLDPLRLLPERPAGPVEEDPVDLAEAGRAESPFSTGPAGQ